MNTFRRRPYEVEAFQLTNERIDSNADWPEWLNEAWNKEPRSPQSVYLHYKSPRCLGVMTSEGPKLPSVFDWIIRDSEGKLDVCKNKDFSEKYEEA